MSDPLDLDRTCEELAYLARVNPTKLGLAILGVIERVGEPSSSDHSIVVTWTDDYLGVVARPRTGCGGAERIELGQSKHFVAVDVGFSSESPVKVADQ